MSWELASFLILGAVLLGGFAWYERSRPPSQVPGRTSLRPRAVQAASEDRVAPPLVQLQRDPKAELRHKISS